MLGSQRRVSEAMRAIALHKALGLTIDNKMVLPAKRRHRERISSSGGASKPCRG